MAQKPPANNILYPLVVSGRRILFKLHNSYNSPNLTRFRTFPSWL